MLFSVVARPCASSGQNLAAILALKDYIYIKRVKSNISNCLLLGALELASALAAAAAACSVCDAAYPSCDVDIFEFAIFAIFAILPFFLIALNLMINHSDQKFKLNINKSEKSTRVNVHLKLIKFNQSNRSICSNLLNLIIINLNLKPSHGVLG